MVHIDIQLNIEPFYVECSIHLIVNFNLISPSSISICTKQHPFEQKKTFLILLRFTIYQGERINKIKSFYCKRCICIQQQSQCIPLVHIIITTYSIFEENSSSNVIASIFISVDYIVCVLHKTLIFYKQNCTLKNLIYFIFTSKSSSYVI